MKSDALAFLAATVFVAAGVSSPPVLADVPSNDTARIQQYEDQAIAFQAQGSRSYTLTRGGKRIDDSLLASLSGDPDLVDEVNTAQRNRHIYQLTTGIIGLPLGLLLAADNFFGHRAGPRKFGGVTLPPSIVAPFPASNPLSFAISVGGAIVALYGAWQLGELIGEAAGAYHPAYLPQAQARTAAKDYNHQLAIELDLTATEAAQAAPEASPSATPNPVPDAFPAGESGSGCWAVRQAVPYVQAKLGLDFQPYLVWTRDLHDFQTGLIQGGVWHVLFAGPDPKADIDASVPLHGNISWTGVRPYFSGYRDGTDLMSTVKVDSPRALFLLKAPFREQQIGWLPAGSYVVLYPYWGRLHGPIWTVQLSQRRLPPSVGIDAEFGTLVNMARYREHPPIP